MVERQRRRDLINTQRLNTERSVEWKLRGEMGIYPPNQSSSLFVRGLLEHVVGQEEAKKLKITVYKAKDPNAFIFPNGSIYISDSLMRMADYREELEFVLGHEYVHFKNQHKEKQASTAEQMEDDYRDRMRSFGQERLNEMEADIESVVSQMDAHGSNPRGAIIMLEKFRDVTQGGFIHGATAGRRINVEQIIHSKTLQSLQNPLTAVPAEIGQDIQNAQATVSSPYEQLVKQINMPHAWTHENDTAIAATNLQQALSILKTVGGIYDRTKDKNKIVNDKATQAVVKLAHHTWQLLDQSQDSSLSSLTDLQKTSLFYAILTMVTDIPAADFVDRFAAAGVPRLEDRIQNPIDLQDGLLSILDPELFAHLDLVASVQPNRLIKYVVQTAVATDIFTAFEGDSPVVGPDAATFFKTAFATLQTLYATAGMENFDPHTSLTVVTNAFHNGDFAESSITTLHDSLAQAYKRKEIIIQGDTPEDQLLSVIDMLEDPAYRKAKARSNKEEALTDPFLASVEKILQNANLTDAKDMLLLSAKLRKKLIDNRELWFEFFNVEIRFYDLITVALEKNYQNFLYKNIIEQVFFDVQLAAILSSLTEAVATFADSHQTFKFLEACEDPSFSFEWFKKFYDISNNPHAIGNMLGIDITTPQVLNNFTLNEGIYTLLRQKSTQSKPELLALLENIATIEELSHYGVDFSDYNPDPLVGRVIVRGATGKKREFLASVFQTHDLFLDNPADLLLLYRLSTYFEDTSIAIHVQNTVVELLLNQFSFEDGLQFLKKEITSRRLLSTQALDYFIRTKTITDEQIERVTQEVKIFFSTQKAFELAGIMMVEEELAENLFPPEKRFDFLLACIGDGQSDGLLKEYFYERWVELKSRKEELLDTFQINDVIQRLYNIDTQTKFILLRTLLVGKEGVLLQGPKEREKLVDFFLDNFVETTTQQDRDLLKTMRSIMTEWVKVADYPTLYFVLAGLLQERLLIPPAQEIQWIDIVHNNKIPDTFIYIDGVRPDSDSHYRAHTKKVAQEVVDVLLLKDIFKNQPANSAFNLQQYYESKAMQLTGIGRPEPVHKLGTTEFLLEVAQHIGAPGIRFLQVIGQVVSLSPEMEQAFSKVYDKVMGQNKLTAWDTVKQEWTNAKDGIIGIEQQAGGGSLMTVFNTYARNTTNAVAAGQKLALKVLNPNSEYLTKEAFTILSQVFTILAQQDPSFAPAIGLLEDIRDWIINDVNYGNFLELDERFRQKYQGFTIGGKYSIKIPRTYYPEELTGQDKGTIQPKTFMIEEWVDGTNLTDTEGLVRQGHDLKEIVSLVTKHFFTQIMDGQLVHSDVHPGNLRVNINVTANNEIAIFDRNYYLQLNQSQQQFLLQLGSQISSPDQALDTSLDYFVNNGTVISAEQRQRLHTELAQITINDPVSTLLHISSLIRKEGIKPPIELTLLIKNLFFIDRLSKKAGFSGILEALAA